MKRAVVLVHKLTDAEVEGLCYRGDLIKQETAEQDTLHAAAGAPNAGNPSGAAHIKGEVRDAELEDITVKEEPVDWHQESQARTSADFSTFAFKIKVENDCTEASTEHAEVEDELREGSSGACNTSAVQQKPAGASQGSADTLPSNVSGSGSGVEAAPPDRLMSRPFLCAHCDYSSGRRGFMEVHLRVMHKLGSYYECELCDYSTIFMSTLKRHVVEQHDHENLYEGLFVGYQSPGVKMTGEQRRDEHGQEELKCEFCSSPLVTKSSSESPKKGVLDNSIVYKCEVCECSSFDEANLKLRLFGERKRGHQLHVRKFNDNSFARRDEHEVHQASKDGRGHLFECEFREYSSAHLSSVLFNCELCDYSSARKKYVKRHLAGNHGIGQQFKCELCEYSSARKDCLNLHRARKHGIGQLFKCELCDYSSAIESRVKEHQASKHGIGQLFKCELCDYSSARKENVNLHRASKHGRGQLFKCELCEYFSARKDYVNLHRASKHGIGRLFRCELCEYSSASPKNLKIHLAGKHGRGQLLKCELCDYSSARKLNVKRHLAGNHGIGELFKCELCDYSSARKDMVKQHRVNKHGIGQRFKCKLCDYSSACKDKIKQHRVSKHGCPNSLPF